VCHRHCRCVGRRLFRRIESRELDVHVAVDIGDYDDCDRADRDDAQ
jgi:hypothetical protein